MTILRIFEKHPHWQDIVDVLNKMAKHKHTAYLAGGCVRDALLDKLPHDFDIATSATPDEVKAVFPQSLEVGRAFGTMIVPIQNKHSGNHQVEITTFRRDGVYADGRHPSTVSFTNAEEDARRRDFTVNALFYDHKNKRIVDYVNGQDDIRKRILQTVGNPHDRFQEDKLRVLRGARFVSQLEFTPSPETLAAMKHFASELRSVSKERITQEFQKIAKCRDLTLTYKVLFETNILNSIWPELKFTLSQEKTNIFMRALYLISPVHSFELMLALIFVIEKIVNPHATNIPTPFVLSRDEKRTIDFLWQGVFVLQSSADESMLLLNDELGPLLTELAFVLTQVGCFPQGLMGDRVAQFLKAADTHGQLPKPLLNGDDLIQLGIKPSAEMKTLLKDVYFAQVHGKIKNKKEAQDWVLLRAGS